MNKKMRELLEQIENKKTEARTFSNEGKVTEAKNLIDEIKNLQAQFDIEASLYEDEKENVQVKNKTKATNTQSLEVQAFKAFINRQPMTEEFQNAVLTSTDGNALVPTELVERLLEEKKQLVQLKNYTTVVPVSAPSGSVPVESADASQLIEFDEVSDLDEQKPGFTSVSYQLANLGAITPVSNNLLKDSVFPIPTIVEKGFARKSVRTENAKILAAAKVGKVAKAINSIKTLKSSINKDIDPAIIDGVLVINQSTFDALDNEVDSAGRSLLTTSATDPNIKKFKHLDVVILSDSELPAVAGKQPMFYGSLKGILSFEDGQYEVSVSADAGFKQHATLMKIVQRFQAKAGTPGDYVFAEFTLPA